MTETLSGEYLRSVGFKGKQVENVPCFWIGETHCTLYIFEGYQSGYWACLGKYQTPQEAARNCAHIERRLKTVDDLHQLVDALGIKLK